MPPPEPLGFRHKISLGLHSMRGMGHPAGRARRAPQTQACALSSTLIASLPLRSSDPSILRSSGPSILRSFDPPTLRSFVSFFDSSPSIFLSLLSSKIGCGFCTWGRAFRGGRSEEGEAEWIQCAVACVGKVKRRSVGKVNRRTRMEKIQRSGWSEWALAPSQRGEAQAAEERQVTVAGGRQKPIKRNAFEVSTSAQHGEGQSAHTESEVALSLRSFD